MTTHKAAAMVGGACVKRKKYNDNTAKKAAADHARGACVKAQKQALTWLQAQEDARRTLDELADEERTTHLKLTVAHEAAKAAKN